MRERFVAKEFTYAHSAVIRQANAIIQDYASQGFAMTLRSPYYQFIAVDAFPNTEQSYKRLIDIVNHGRLAGRIDWDGIEDMTRYLREYDMWVNPQGAIDTAIRRYLEDLWRDQEYRVEVWIEKDAALNVITPACQRWRLPHFSCRGNVSQSEMYIAGKRLQEIVRGGQRVLILHLGDHDPSGIDMTRDIMDRLEMFCGEEFEDIEIRRIALNMDQIRQYNPPHNPAKRTDSRFKAYERRFDTDKSWELDCLRPTVFDSLIEKAVVGVLDRKKWDILLAEETEHRTAMKRAGTHWPDVVKFLDKWERFRAS